MTQETLNSFNWIDILMVAILIRVAYIGIKRGLVVELFKLVGVFFAVFITLHYFSGVSKFLQDKVHLPQAAADLFSFSGLWGVTILVFKFIRDGFTLLFKIEAAHTALDKGGGLAVCLLRAILLCSLTTLFLRTTSIDYFTKNLEKSVTANKLAILSPNLYEATYDNFVSRFFPTEAFNKSAYKLTDFNTEKETPKKK